MRSKATDEDVQTVAAELRGMLDVGDPLSFKMWLAKTCHKYGIPAGSWKGKLFEACWLIVREDATADEVDAMFEEADRG